MALVEMDHRRLDLERLQQPGSADPEQAVLGEAHGPVALVQAGGRPALHRVVLGQIGVQQEQRDTADVDPPDLEGERGSVERHPELQRLSVGAS